MEQQLNKMGKKTLSGKLSDPWYYPRYSKEGIIIKWKDIEGTSWKNY